MKLKPQQAEGVDKLAGKTRALLADEPGVGKTPQAVLACAKLRVGRVRVICPAIGLQHWEREFRKWYTYAGMSMLPRIEIMSFDAIRPATTRCDVLIVDEGHYAKNPSAKRTQAVFARGGQGWFADHIWVLGGTPSPNNASELWPVLFAFGATPLGYDSFIARYCRVNAKGRPIGTRLDRVDELRAILAPYLIRKMLDEVHPELGSVEIVQMPVTARTDYIGILTEGSTLDGSYAREKAGRQELILQREIKGLSQKKLLEFLASNRKEFATLRRYNALVKAPDVFDTVCFELDNGLLDRIVIFGYHQEAMMCLKAAFDDSGHGAELIYGGSPQRSRDVSITRWTRRNGPRVMIASIISAGVLVDFTAANEGIMLELDWVPGNNLQAMRRMLRHGQTKPVRVRLAQGTSIDHILDRVLLSKTKEINAIFK